VRAGGVEFLPASSAFPAGSMLFVMRGGAP
jgi:hypothetical protein